jgi:hypothetical protein
VIGAPAGLEVSRSWEMADDREAAQAMADLNGKEVAGRALQVNEAAPRLERSRPRGRGDFGPGAR